MVVLSYLWVFCAIPLVAEPDDPVVRWHAAHGLVLLLCEIVGTFVWFVGAVLLRALLPAALMALVVQAGPVLWTAALVLRAVLLVDALQGRRWRIPVVTGYAQRLLASSLEPLT
jgi:uncharacterized membrane protein